MAVGALLSLIPSIINMFTSSSSANKYQEKVDDIKNRQKISDSALQAKALFAENAARGLQGYETIKEDINNQMPTTLNESRDWLTGGGVVDYLTRAQANTAKQLRDLNMANEQEKQRNMQMYAQYLGGSMANREDALQNSQNELDIAAANAGVYKDASLSNTLTGMAGNLLGVSTGDLAGIIALLSGRKDVSKFTIQPGQAADMIGSESYNDLA
jgi:hypothetical protein